MKYAKMLGLLAVAAAAMMAFAATASATTVTAPAGTLYTSTIEASSEGATSLDGTVEVTCQKSTVKGSVASHGAGVTAKGSISSLTFTECGDDVVQVKNAGSLEVHSIGGGDGTLTSSGAEVTVEADTIFGDVHCIYTTSNTHIGTVKDGTHATMTIDSAAIPRTGGSFLCGSSGEWTGAYTVTKPTGLTID
jgi:hypothetical protein